VSELHLHSPAKVNLALSVGGPDPQRRLHPIASWMAALEFGDRLHLTPQSHRATSRFQIAFAADAPVACEVDWPLEKDLACRAHAAMVAHVGRPLPVQATLLKRVPTGAGLGGGSGNAAAMLVALARAFQLPISRQQLIALGQQLGSDVGFQVAAVLGQPSALVSGFGEHVEPLPMPNPLDLVLIFPGFGCPTGPVYAAFDDALNDPKRPDEQAVRHLATQWPVPPDGPFNDLAAPACRVQPRLGELLDVLRRRHNLVVHVTGSGSTLFVLASDAAEAEQIARRIVGETGLAALATRTLSAADDWAPAPPPA
jgi:4-diphosphocytidyl-2-C-methyl-D-erythritol kinase